MKQRIVPLLAAALALTVMLAAGKYRTTMPGSSIRRQRFRTGCAAKR